MNRISHFSFKASLIGLVVFAALSLVANAAAAQSTVIDVNPNYSIRAGIDALNDGQVNKAIKHFERALHRNLNTGQQVIVYNNLCVAHNYAGHAERAVENCETALRLDPTDWRSALNLGNVYFDQGRWLDAHAQYTRALELNPGQEIILQNLALVERTQIASAE